MGGFLGQMDPRLPFWVAAGLSLANALYGAFVLPESLPHDQRHPFSWKRANPVGSLVLLMSKPGLLGIAAVNFLGYMAHVVLPSTFVLYATHRYGWNERTLGLVLAGVGVGSLIVQGGLVGPIVKAWGERNTLFFGLVCGVAGFLVAGFAPNGPLFLISIPLESLWSLSGAAAMALMTARVGASEQGQLQGANNGMRAISELLGPGIFTTSFAFAIGSAGRSSWVGLPFILSAGFLAAAFALALKVARHEPRATAAASAPLTPS
jgi:DHA1 family tetracycline resistance protein-like MFS transporter